jgi:D-alanine transaminase
MSRIAYIDRRYQPLNQPGIMVEDRGYQFSDGVYEVFAIRHHRPLDEARHLDRLEYSLGELGMEMPMSREAIKIVAREVMRRNRVSNGLLYIQVTRGVAPREHSFASDLKPVLVMTVRPISTQRRDAIRRDGIRVITVPDQRWARCDIKSISLLPNVLARQSAKQAGVQEAWQIDQDGLVTEGAATNAWIVDAEGRLRTRAANEDILNGIIRQVIFDVAESLQLQVDETAFTLAEAKAAKECFSTASTMAVFPVTSIDGETIGDGQPGPVATALGQAYDAIGD